MFPRFLRAHARSGVVSASLTAALVAAPAAPALAQDADDPYTVEAAEVDLKKLPDGGEAIRTEIPVPPNIETASAPGAWLAPSTRTEIDLEHTVQQGESLGDIAAAYGLDERDGWRPLFDANDEVERPWHIWPGLELSIPMDGDELTRREVPEKPAPAPEPQEQADTESREERSRASRSDSRSSATSESSSSQSTTVSGGRWDALAACESGGNWSINTGNGYYGGLQFSLQSWRAVGGSGYPHQASKAEQIKRAEMLLARQGWGAWPACTSKLGWR